MCARIESPRPYDDADFSRRRVAIEFRAGRVTAFLLSLTVLTACSTTVGGAPSASRRAVVVLRFRVGGSEFTPSEDNEDPAKDIDGVVVTEYEPAHAQPGQRVAYTKAPPDGGRHDQVWANCAGTVYPDAVRNEHMVHALEHGAVWIAYNPDDLRRRRPRRAGRPGRRASRT